MKTTIHKNDYLHSNSCNSYIFNLQPHLDYNLLKK